MTQTSQPIPTLEEKKDNTEASESVFSAHVVAAEPVVVAKEQVQEEAPIVPLKNLIFEITYLADSKEKKSGLAYTETAPEFDTLGFVDVKNVFGCLVLREVVLNRETVERKCRQPLEIQNFTIDCRQGILIKTIESQPWMSQKEDETKLEFDKAVLDTFRAIQSKVAQELHQAELASARAEAEKEQLKIRNLGQQENIPHHSPVQQLNPGDPGYNPNNDLRLRQKAVPVNNEALDDL